MAPSQRRSRPKLPAHSGAGELALIAHIRAVTASRRSTPALRLGIGDDCAVLAPLHGEEIVVTTDFSLEGRHFTRDRHSPQSVGHRVLARGLSDIAAMGARPLAAFLSLALPRAVARDRGWIDGFLAGLTGLARHARVPLAGGDTSESPSEHVLADIALLGSVPAGTALRRDGARPGDLLYCTGALGGAAAELREVLSTAKHKQPPAQADGDHPHLFPQPRLLVGELLRERKIASACLDLSDGVSTDLAHLCGASAVSAEIELARIPLHPRSRNATPEERLRLALHGGEDYELLFTARPGTRVPRSIAGVPMTCIGRMLPRKRNQVPVQAIAADGTRAPLPAEGWEHLR